MRSPLFIILLLRAVVWYFIFILRFFLTDLIGGLAHDALSNDSITNTI